MNAVDVPREIELGDPGEPRRQVKGKRIAPKAFAGSIQDFNFGGISQELGGGKVQDRDLIGRAVPEDVYRLAGVAAGKIGRGGFQVVVIGLPKQARPNRLAGPKENTATAVFKLRRPRLE